MTSLRNEEDSEEGDDENSKKRPFSSSSRQSNAPWTQQPPWEDHEFIDALVFEKLVQSGFAEDTFDVEEIVPPARYRRYQWDTSSATPAYKLSPIVPSEVVSDDAVGSLEVNLGPTVVDNTRIWIASKTAQIQRLWAESDRQLVNRYTGNAFNGYPSGSAIVPFKVGDTTYYVPRQALFVTHGLPQSSSQAASPAKTLLAVRFVLDAMFPSDVDANIVSDSDSDSDVDKNDSKVPWYEQPAWADHAFINADDYEFVFRDRANPRPYAVWENGWLPLSEYQRPYYRDENSLVPKYNIAPFPVRIDAHLREQINSVPQNKKVVDQIFRKADVTNKAKVEWGKCTDQLPVTDDYDEDDIQEYSPGLTTRLAVVKLAIGVQRIKFPLQAIHVIDRMGLVNMALEHGAPGPKNRIVALLAIKLCEMAGPAGTWRVRIPDSPDPQPKPVKIAVSRLPTQRTRIPRAAKKHLGRGALYDGPGLEISSDSEPDPETTFSTRYGFNPQDALDYNHQRKLEYLAARSLQKRASGISIQDVLASYQKFNSEVFKGKLPAACGVPDLNDTEYKIAIVWSSIPRRASGATYMTRAPDGRRIPTYIVMNSLPIASVEAMESTLAHEMCHVADELFNCPPPGDNHGPGFDAMAAKFKGKYGTLQVQKWCDGCYRYLWECKHCNCQTSTPEDEAPTECLCCNVGTEFVKVGDRGGRLDGRDVELFSTECTKCGKVREFYSRPKTKDGLAVGIRCDSEQCAHLIEFTMRVIGRVHQKEKAPE